MNVLFIGMSEKAGSAIMRGQQIASTRDRWTYIYNPTDRELQGYDIIVLVKKARQTLVERIRATGSVFVYDPLDFWGQEYIPSSGDARVTAKRHFGRVNADIVIATHEAYQRGIQDFCKRVEVIPHHFDPRLPITRRRNDKVLVYYGQANYISHWYLQILRACGQAGWGFLVNPSDMSCASAMIGARNAEHACWINRQWKSSVKLATAEGVGVPFIHDGDESYREFANEHCYEFKDEGELTHILLTLNKNAPINNRFSVEEMAKKYEVLFSSTR